MTTGSPHLFEDLLDEYEHSWKQGTPLEIQTLLDRWENEGASQRQTSEQLLSELIMISLEYFWKQSEFSESQPPHEGLLENYDEVLIQQLDQAGLKSEVLIEEFRSRCRWGDPPSLEEYERRFPHEFMQISEELHSIEQEYALESSIRRLFVDSSEDHPLEGPKSAHDLSMQDFLANVYPFCELPDELRIEISSTAVERSFETGDILMDQGDEATSLMVVMEGIAKISISQQGDEEQELARVGTHSVLGEIGLLTGEARSAKVCAMTEMRVAEVPYESYQTLSTRFPNLNMLFSELIAQRVGTIGTDIMFGKTLGGYRFRHRLGRGSMGIVYLAEDTRDSQAVAIKMLRHDLVYDRQASLRFRREAEVVRRLHHVNIIEVYREFSAYNTFFLSMEYCRGCTLGEAIRSHAPFPFDDIRLIIGQLASALDHAHRQGVIHRDLKPANVMLTRDGILKLTDFGLARSVECLKMTAHGQMLGTPRYMPSELLGGGDADERADLYALGVIAWELITGNPLFTAGDIVTLLRQQMRWELPSANEIAEGLPEDLYQLLVETLSQDPEERVLNLEPLTTLAGTLKSEYCRSDDQSEDEEESLQSTMRLTENQPEEVKDQPSTQ